MTLKGLLMALGVFALAALLTGYFIMAVHSNYTGELLGAFFGGICGVIALVFSRDHGVSCGG